MARPTKDMDRIPKGDNNCSTCTVVRTMLSQLGARCETKACVLYLVTKAVAQGVLGDKRPLNNMIPTDNHCICRPIMYFLRKVSIRIAWEFLQNPHLGGKKGVSKR